MLHKLQHNMIKFNTFTLLLVAFFVANSLAAPTLPEIEDPLFIEDFVLDVGNLNETAELADGIISLCNGTITGLSGLLDRVVITPAPGIGQPLRQRVIINVTIPTAAISGRYTADVELYESLLPESGHVSLSGQGGLTGSLTNGYLNVQAFILPLGKSVDERAAMSSLEFDVGFESAIVYLEDLTVNGTLIDWVEFNRDVKEIFDEVMRQVKGPLADLINDAVNYMIEDCTIADLIGIIGGGPTDCFKIPTPPELGIRDDMEIPCQGTAPAFECPEEGGNHADPRDCSKYYACQDFLVIGHLTCPDDLLFNPVIGNCDFPWNVDCPV